MRLLLRDKQQLVIEIKACVACRHEITAAPLDHDHKRRRGQCDVTESVARYQKRRMHLPFDHGCRDLVGKIHSMVMKNTMLNMNRA